MTTNYSPRLHELINSAKALAREYYELTGRSLGITGEVAEVTAVQTLGLELAEVRQAGYDAVRRGPNGAMERIQIKGRCCPPGANPGQRVGRIQLEKEWDSVILVLMDQSFELLEIHEAPRAAIAEALTKPGSVARNERGALGVPAFKRIGRRIYPSETPSRTQD